MKTLSNNEQTTTNHTDTSPIKLNDKKLQNTIVLQQNDLNCDKMKNAVATGEADATADANDLSCGFGQWRPRWLQRFLSAKWVLFWLCWAGAMQGK
jgi:NRPS condensation-like uncharacterized protein